MLVQDRENAFPPYVYSLQSITTRQQQGFSFPQPNVHLLGLPTLQIEAADNLETGKLAPGLKLVQTNESYSKLLWSTIHTETIDTFPKHFYSFLGFQKGNYRALGSRFL